MNKNTFNNFKLITAYLMDAAYFDTRSYSQGNQTLKDTCSRSRTLNLKQLFVTIIKEKNSNPHNFSYITLCF